MIYRSSVKPSEEEIDKAHERTMDATRILISEMNAVCPDTFKIQLKEKWGTTDIIINKSVIDFNNTCSNLTGVSLFA